MLPKRPTTAASLTMVIYQAVVFGLFVFVCISAPEVLSSLGFKFDYHPVISFFTGILIYLGFYGFLFFVQSIIGVEEKVDIHTFGISRKIWPRNKHLKWMMFIAICLLNPITEEVLFRGFVVYFGGHHFDNIPLAIGIGVWLCLLPHLNQGMAAIGFQTIFHGIAILILFSNLGLIACIGYHYAGAFIPLARAFENWRKIAPLYFRFMREKTNTELVSKNPSASNNAPKPGIGQMFLGFLILAAIAFAIYQFFALLILNNTSVSKTQLNLAVLFIIAALVIVSNIAKIQPKLWRTGIERNLSNPRMTSTDLLNTFVVGASFLVIAALLIKDDETIQTLLGIKHHYPLLLSFVVGLITVFIFSKANDLLNAKMGRKQKSQTIAYLSMRTLWPRKTLFKILMLFVYVVFVPLTEELFLRGVAIYALGSLTGVMPVVVFVGLIITVLMHLSKSDIASLIELSLITATSIALLLSPFGLMACIGFHCGAMSMAFWQFHRNWRTWLAQYRPS